jgi:hypothetical protein
LELQVIKAGEFVRLDPRNHLDFEATRDALSAMARACRKRGVDRAILDLRNVPIPAKPLLTRDELSSLVETFHEAGFARHQRLAVLYRQDPHQGVRKFAFIGTLQGWNVRAFSDFEKALTWLSEDNGERQSSARPIPIRIAKRKVHAICE